VADDANTLPAKAAEAANDRRVFAVLAIARKRNEIVDHRGDVIETMGPLRMARDLRLLPRRE